MVDVAKWGKRPLLLHRGLADDPAHLHARDPARLQGLARRAAVQAAADRRPATRRSRRSTGRACRRSAATSPRTLEAHRRAGPHEPSGGSGARHLAVRARPLGRVHLRRQGEVGVLWLRWRDFNKFWSQLIALDAAQRHPERHGRDRGAAGRHRRGRRRRRRRRRASSSTSSTRRSAWWRRTGSGTVIDLEQVGPGRYRGHFPAAQEGVYLVGMAQRRNDRVIGSQLAGLVVPYAQELRDLGRRRESAPASSPSSTGGGALAKPQDAFLTARRQSRIACRDLALARRARRAAARPGHCAPAHRPRGVRPSGHARPSGSPEEGGSVMHRPGSRSWIARGGRGLIRARRRRRGRAPSPSCESS